MTRGKLVIVSGPSSGAGKDTIINAFLKRHPDWYRSASVTTRLPRETNENDERMKYVDSKTFKLWQEQGKFLETDFHTGAWYGTLREPIETRLRKGINVIKLVDVNGAQLLKKEAPSIILVFIRAENHEALESRIRNRASESEEEIQKRLKLAEHELTFENKFDHVIINRTNQIDEAVIAFEKILGL